MADADETPIWQSARKHGVSDESIRHALRNYTDYTLQGDGMTMVIGPDYDGTPIEVGIITRNGQSAIAHAIRPARPKYLR